MVLSSSESSRSVRRSEPLGRIRTFCLAVLAVCAFAPASAFASGTMTFSSLGSSPYSYTEGGLRVFSNYNNGSSGHLHGSNQRLSIHTGCCSTPYRFHTTSGATFQITSFSSTGSGTMVSSNGTSQSFGSGTITLGSGFANSAWIEWRAGGGTIDNVVWVDVPLNTAPTISNVGNQTINEDSTTGAIGFTVNDAEDSNGSLTVTASSSNTSLIPSGNLSLGGSGSNRTITATPVANASGSATITLTVTDSGGLSASDTFTVTVNAVNDAPTITTVANQTIAEDGTTGALSFTLNDVDHNNSNLQIASSSSNTALVPTSGLVHSGAGSTRQITVTPAANQTGTVTITLTTTDPAGATASSTFTVTVTPVNDAPTISNVANQTIPEDGTTGPLPFTVADIDDTASSLTVTGSSSNTTLLPNANIVFGGSGGNRTVTATPASNANGTATVTLTVTDAGGLSATDTFTLTVSSVNDAPVADAGPTTGAAGYLALEGGNVAVDGSNSTDSDGTVVAWSWDCDGDGTYGDATGQTATCTTQDDGVYTIGLQVTDDAGATATDTATLTVTNVAPSATVTGPSSGNEGDTLSFTGAGTDPSPVDAANLTYAWNITDPGGAVVGSGTGTAITHTFAQDGLHTITLNPTDPQGATGQGVLVVGINNVAPTASASFSPASPAAGQQVTFTGSATDPGVLDTHTYSWDFGDGSALGSGATSTHTYANPGTYTVVLTVTDDAGDTDTDTLSVTVANTAPSVVASGASGGTEGDTLSWSAVGTDTPSDQANLTYGWVLTSGGATVATGAGASFSHTFADDGSYTATVTVTDPGGLTGTDSVAVTVNNANPSASASGDTTGDEGDVLSFTGTGTDVGSVDQANLTYSWNFGDGTPAATGASTTHAFGDNGSYTVTLTVTDPQGGSDSATVSVVVDNVAPSIVTTAPTFAAEGVLYTYQAGASDPAGANDPLTWTLLSGPTGMAISATGEVTWTPGFADVGNHPASIEVADDDGALDTESFTVTVGFADADNDGMADTWETANGLDPNDPSDAGLDPDADGLTNLDEFLAGLDPNVYDGPDVPVPLAPIGAVEIVEASPSLSWQNAVDGNAEPLTYDVEVYADAAMTTLLTSTLGLPETAGTSAWTVDVTLAENTDTWWRVRASDPHVSSSWSNLEEFFVNTENEAPGTPVAIQPLDGDSVSLARPELLWTEAADADRDAVTYSARVTDRDGNVVTLITEVVGETVEVDVDLNEDTQYFWDVQAVDEHGLAGEWSIAQEFFVNLSNNPPGEVVFTSPDDGAMLESQSPTFEANETSDPEGGAVVYVIELDTVETFDSGSFVDAVIEHTGNGTVRWDLRDDAVVLEDNLWWFARIRAEDEDGGASDWDNISVFMLGANDPPHVPALLSPADGTSTEDGLPVLAIGHVEDPEMDEVTYEIQVSTDAEGTNVVARVAFLGASEGPEGTADQTSWQVEEGDMLPVGVWYWTARAVDSHGEASDWADVWSYEVVGEDAPPPPDADPEGCSCENSVAGASAGNGTLALLLLLGLVRRRRG